MLICITDSLSTLTSQAILMSLIDWLHAQASYRYQSSTELYRHGGLANFQLTDWWADCPTKLKGYSFWKISETDMSTLAFLLSDVAAVWQLTVWLSERILWLVTIFWLSERMLWLVTICCLAGCLDLQCRKHSSLTVQMLLLSCSLQFLTGCQSDLLKRDTFQHFWKLPKHLSFHAWLWSEYFTGLVFNLSVKSASTHRQ